MQAFSISLYVIRSIVSALNKIKYATRKAALNAANTSNKIHDIQLRVYKCNICRHYHLTSRAEA